MRRNNERESEFIVALEILQAFSSTTAERKKGGFILHRLIQLFTINWLELQCQKEYLQHEALQISSTRFPNGEYENGEACEVLSSHARVVMSRYISDFNLLLRAELLYRLASFELLQGQHDDACKSSKESYIERQNMLCKNNYQTSE